MNTGAARVLAQVSVAVAILTGPGRAAGQSVSSLPILLETARDPGRADVPPTARSLALGGVRGPSDGADPVANPAGVVFGPRAELVMAGGGFTFARDELSLTPDQLPPFKPDRTPSASSTSPVMFAAAAVRHSIWAIAGFYDSTERFSHHFTTAQDVVNVSAIPGFIETDRATGTGAVSKAVTRFGGALAVSSPGHRVSVGAAGYLVRLDATFDAAVTTDSLVQIYAPYPPSIGTRTYHDENHVAFGNWGAGVSLGVVFKPVERAAIGLRWQHDPTMASVRTAALGSSPPQTIAESVELDLPQVIAVSGSVTVGRTALLAALDRIGYGTAFGPEAPALSPTSLCQTLSVSRCDGWGFGNYRTTDANAFRFGVEQSVPTGTHTLLIRGGLAFEPAYTAARSTADPNINALQGPVPPLLTPFEPPRESTVIWSYGAAYRWRAVELGAGFAHGPQSLRSLVDFRIRR